MQVNCSSYPLQCLQSWVFVFYSNSVLKLFCFNSWTSTKALLSVGDCQVDFLWVEDGRKLLFYLVDVTTVKFLLSCQIF